METTPIDPLSMLRPKRKITGASAILLPFQSDGSIDWRAFEAHIKRTIEAGLIPAVNMDTGYVNLLHEPDKLDVLRHTQSAVAGKPFYAGAFVYDEPGDKFDRDAYLNQIVAIQTHGGTPVIFQSHGLVSQSDDAVVASYEAIATGCDRFIGFELGKVFAPFGRIYSLEVYEELLNIKACIGAKHSSLNRDQEWRRLKLRDKVRPDFMVMTGNDLAIDMVMYGSDYLLGLSTFAPDLFAKRDALWAAGDANFYELNDVLQYLGFLTFRPPVPAYKHSAAMFLKLRGWLTCDNTHRESPTRPESDRDILRDILTKLDIKEST